VVDREGLDDDPGPRIRVRIGVPPAWAEARATVTVEAPRRSACARCEGGGCDGCGRSGVVRLADEPAARTFEVQLPASLGAGALVRLVRPFGAESPVAQVLCEIRPTAEPEGCSRPGTASGALVRVPPPGPLVRAASAPPWTKAAFVVALVVAALSWVLTHVR